MDLNSERMLSWPIAFDVPFRDAFALNLTGSGVSIPPSHHISMRTNLDGCRVSDSGALCSALVRHRNRLPPISIPY
jgi:hypothetical protein